VIKKKCCVSDETDGRGDEEEINSVYFIADALFCVYILSHICSK
jgi:hypothetical protein